MDDPIVVEITDPRVTRDGVALLTTLEGGNPSRSIKDRMVRGELGELVAAGALRPGDSVSEVSAGSTARSLALYCRERGLACELFVPDTLPDDQVAELGQLGARVHRGSRETGYALYEEFCAREQPYRFEQLTDPTKSRHYRILGAAAQAFAGTVDAVLGAVGTGHSLLGTAEGIQPRPLVVSAEPADPGAIAGVRNVELERFGPQDGCTPDLFDLRLVLSADQRRDYASVRTDRGAMSVGESFALVLSAVPSLLEARPVSRVFLVGAANRLEAQQTAAVPG
ncbi:MAG: pyridoxal-phosphate dependent enzyme [Egibacteraceae bacterium]